MPNHDTPSSRSYRAANPLQIARDLQTPFRLVAEMKPLTRRGLTVIRSKQDDHQACNLVVVVRRYPEMPYRVSFHKQVSAFGQLHTGLAPFLLSYYPIRSRQVGLGFSPKPLPLVDVPYVGTTRTRGCVSHQSLEL